MSLLLAKKSYLYNILFIFMDIYLLIGILLTLSGILAWAISSNFSLRKNILNLNNDSASKQTNIDLLSKQLDDLQAQKINLENLLQELNNRITEQGIENATLLERIRATTEEKAKIQLEAENRFKLLANDILEEKSKQFKETNETRINEILNPLKENIENFKKTISDSYGKEAMERRSLQDYIKQLIEVNNTIGKEAKDLTLALRGNSKTQGDWGEMILENILEKSGLTRDQEFFVQATRGDDGSTIQNGEGSRLRPDVIVKFPDDKRVIIDSKVSLSAYVNYVNADTPDEQERYIKQHLLSVRRHIDELRSKQYQDYVKGAADYVMMFIPNEGAYISAMQHDHNLWQYAYDYRVVIICPTHLISVLSIIAQLWQKDKQTKNAIKIADEGGSLYDKFVGFMDDMDAIGKSIQKTNEAYNAAKNKLSEGRGNIMSRVENMRILGAKAKKSLNLPDED